MHRQDVLFTPGIAQFRGPARTAARERFAARHSFLTTEVLHLICIARAAVEACLCEERTNKWDGCRNIDETALGSGMIVSEIIGRIEEQERNVHDPDKHLYCIICNSGERWVAFLRTDTYMCNLPSPTKLEA